MQPVPRTVLLTTDLAAVHTLHQTLAFFALEAAIQDQSETQHARWGRALRPARRVRCGKKFGCDVATLDNLTPQADFAPLTIGRVAVRFTLRLCAVSQIEEVARLRPVRCVTFH